MGDVTLNLPGYIHQVEGQYWRGRWVGSLGWRRRGMGRVKHPR
jgi:hypothetical protein